MNDLHRNTFVAIAAIAAAARAAAYACDDGHAAAELRRLRSLDPHVAAMLAADLYGNNTDWIWNEPRTPR